MDAQQRLLLEHSARALAQAAAAGDAAAAATSVMVGIGTIDYTAVSAHLGNSLYAASGDLPFSKTTEHVESNIGRYSSHLRVNTATIH